jgi:hypothetical protein
LRSAAWARGPPGRRHRATGVEPGLTHEKDHQQGSGRRLAGGIPRWGRGAVTGGMLRRALRLEEVERSEEGQKILRGNMWGWRSPRIGNDDGESANFGAAACLRRPCLDRRRWEDLGVARMR